MLRNTFDQDGPGLVSLVWGSIVFGCIWRREAPRAPLGYLHAAKECYGYRTGAFVFATSCTPAQPVGQRAGQ